MSTNYFVLMGLITVSIIVTGLSNNGLNLEGYKSDLRISDSIPVIKKSQKTEDRIIAKIFTLQEVKIENKYIDSLSGHKSGISIMIIKRPDAKCKYFWVQAGLNNNVRYEPYYNFYVYKSHLEVKFFDPMSNEILSLEQWRGRLKIK